MKGIFSILLLLSVGFAFGQERNTTGSGSVSVGNGSASTNNYVILMTGSSLVKIPYSTWMNTRTNSGDNTTEYFFSGRRTPFFQDNGGPSPAGGGFYWKETLWGTNVTLLYDDHKNGEVVFYWGGSENQAQSFRVSATADGNPDPRMTFAFLVAGDELDRTYSLHQTNMEYKFAGAHQGFVWQDKPSDGSITFGGTNQLTKMQGSNITFFVGNSTGAGLQVLDLQSNRNVRIGSSGADGRIEFWADDGGGFSGIKIGYDTGNSALRAFNAGLVVDQNISAQSGFFTGLQLSSLSASTLAALDGSKNITNVVIGTGLAYTSATRTLGVSAIPISSITQPGLLVTNGHSSAVTLSNALTVVGHLISVGAKPTIVTNSGAGSGTGTVTIDANGTDTKGQITLTTGSTPGAQGTTVFTVTFNGAYGIAPNVFLMPTDNASRALGLFPATSSTTTFTTQAAVALTGATTYHWNYLVIQ